MNICLKPEVNKIKGLNTSNPERSGYISDGKSLVVVVGSMVCLENNSSFVEVGSTEEWLEDR